MSNTNSYIKDSYALLHQVVYSLISGPVFGVAASLTVGKVSGSIIETTTPAPL
jgi:hypothetical protein